MNISKKVKDRLVAGLKRFQPVIESAKKRDVNESDTVTIVADVLSEVLGYDKYTEVTREYSIRGTYCDVALKVNGELHMIVEVKAIGLELKDQHIKQATDYAANEGVEWVLLTNGYHWDIYKVLFQKPISFEHIYHFDFVALNTRDQESLNQLFLLSREAIGKSALETFHQQKEATGKACIAAILLSPPVINLIRREARRISPGVTIQPEDIVEVLKKDVIKREIIDGVELGEFCKKVKRVQKKAEKKVEKTAPQPTDITPTEAIHPITENESPQDPASTGEPTA